MTGWASMVGSWFDAILRALHAARMRHAELGAEVAKSVEDHHTQQPLAVEGRTAIAQHATKRPTKAKAVPQRGMRRCWGASGSSRAPWPRSPSCIRRLLVANRPPLILRCV
jgi:hypothetical protein